MSAPLTDSQQLTNLIRVEKAKLWEQAKGTLRAMIAVEGQCNPNALEHSHHRDRWRSSSVMVERFIAEIEDNGLHE